MARDAYSTRRVLYTSFFFFGAWIGGTGSRDGVEKGASRLASVVGDDDETGGVCDSVEKHQDATRGRGTKNKIRAC